MRIAYFDCFSGASGDMILGALVDAGLDLEALRAQLATLPVEGFAVGAERVVKKGIAAMQFDPHVDAETGQPHRHLRHIREIVNESGLSAAVKERVLAVFGRLAEAEASVHGTSPDNVHFHEVGAVDAIVDICGACIALELLGIGRVVCSAIPVGSGTVVCDHGTLPVPAPATATLLEGVPLAACEEVGELITPTGAAILTTVAERFGPIPAMTLTATGFGAGRREGRDRPNVLRVLLGETAEDAEADEITVLQVNLDDTPPEAVGYVIEKLFEAGALDAFSTPIGMKKNRPAVMLTVLADAAAVPACEALLFAETTTFGVRRHTARRSKLARSYDETPTRFGRVRVKVGRRAGRVITATPEYEDCRRAAAEHKIALRDVMDEASRAWHAAQQH